MMIGHLLLSLLVSLGMTLALELAFAGVAGKRGKDLLLVGLVNVITNPIVVLCYVLVTNYTALSPVLLKAALEIAAVLTEAVYYKKHGGSFRRPIMFSLGANGFSFAVGEIIGLIGGRIL